MIFYYPLICLWALLSRNMADETEKSYLQKRKEFIQDEKTQQIGGKLTLNDKEKSVDQFLMKTKQSEIDEAYKQENFPPSLHFFDAKSQIDASKVFNIIKTMPKGAALHIHDSSIADVNWLVKRATYDPHCYMCYQDNKTIVFHFFNHPPTDKPEGCTPWLQVVEERNKSGSARKFDQMLHSHMSLLVPNPQEAYLTQDKAWEKFSNCFISSMGLFTYAPVFRDYYTQALKEFHQDNVQYMEIRVLLPEVYELDGTTHDMYWSMQTCETLTNQFVQENPDFVGVKLIYTTIRSLAKTVISEGVKNAIQLVERFPSFCAGYDLVGQEDQGHPLWYFLDDLLYPEQHNIKLKYFFHAGETNWEGRTVDENLIDAILLNTSRIGHGYAVTKHPKVMKEIKDKEIAIEVNPISNQVLKLVSDLRNHPAATLMAEDYPVVISSDDPAMWGAQGLSYDFYEAFMGLGGAWADLRTLKKLAQNSIRYSAMDPTEMKHAFQVWQKKWDAFIDDIIFKYQLPVA